MAEAMVGTVIASGYSQTDVTLAPVAVPRTGQPGVLTLGGLALLARRRTV